MIPTMMLVLGAVLYGGPGTSKAPLKLIGGVAAFRLLIMPAIGNPPLRNSLLMRCVRRQSHFTQSSGGCVAGSVVLKTGLIDLSSLDVA